MDQQVGGAGILILAIDALPILVWLVRADDNPIGAWDSSGPIPLAIGVNLKRAVGVHGAHRKDSSFVVRQEIDHSTEGLVCPGHSPADLGQSEIV
jgi:hypothetical protein